MGIKKGIILSLCWIFFVFTQLNGECKKCESKDGPGNDNPDENYSFASPSSFEILPSKVPDLIILKNGYFTGAGVFVQRLKRDLAFIEPDQSPSEMESPPPVWIIPTGGLYGMEKSSQFKSTLEYYVRNGGVLIVFSQQHGYEFSALPTTDGRPIKAYGWREAQSCFSNSTYISSFHPSVSSLTESVSSAPIDGYFEVIPESSVVILRRTQDSSPVLFYYPYGAGFVILTSLYEDWASVNFQSTGEGRRIVRDLISWAMKPESLPTYNLSENPNPTVSLDIEIRNSSDKPASKVKILWLNPEREYVLTKKLNLIL